MLPETDVPRVSTIDTLTAGEGSESHESSLLGDARSSDDR